MGPGFVWGPGFKGAVLKAGGANGEGRGAVLMAAAGRFDEPRGKVTVLFIMSSGLGTTLVFLAGSNPKSSVTARTHGQFATAKSPEMTNTFTPLIILFFIVCLPFS
ncbi:MAG: hypothetical protein A2901_01770 [Elusimicrobia bacterium RIFCSPLOWO2_01_FULL_54_10]|nr:MAG: hypothetical protein A2901_01770 [Elusimicrobia bacterium RIFCSPLOWO2_01_FULL_54_10]